MRGTLIPSGPSNGFLSIGIWFAFRSGLKRQLIEDY